MKVNVNENCIGCGKCVALTEEKVFEFSDEGYAKPVSEEVPEELQEIAKEALNECPVGAIEEK